MIVVYTAPNCPPCRLTKRALDWRGLAYPLFSVFKASFVLDQPLKSPMTQTCSA